MRHTQACHDQNTVSSKLDVSGLCGRVKALQGAVKLEMTMICPRICLWLNKTIMINFSLFWFLKIRTKDDISNGDNKLGVSRFYCNFQIGRCILVQVGKIWIILNQFLQMWYLKIRVNKAHFQYVITIMMQRLIKKVWDYFQGWVTFVVCTCTIGL